MSLYVYSVMHTPRRLRRIKRPSQAARAAVYPYEDLLSTLGSEHAVLYPGKGDEVRKALASMRRHLYRKRLRLCQGPAPSGLALWVERMEGVA